MDKFRQFLKKFKIRSLAVAVALIIIGILFIVFPDNAARIICYVAGATLLVWGILSIMTYFVYGMKEFDSYSLVGGVALIAVSVLLFVKPDFVAEVLTILFGIVLVIVGVMKVQQASEMARYKIPRWWLMLIVAIVFIVLGAVTVFDPFNSKSALMIFAGVSLIADGISDIITVCWYSMKMEEVRRRLNSDVIDI